METTTNSICTQLGNLIKTTLVPLIDSDYIYLDLPYHSNIGDILIWQGTEDFLKELPGKCLGRHSKETFDFRPLSKNVTVLMHGGGNFGDIWREHQEFRLDVMSHYPDNRIIVFPQTVYYESDTVFADDIREINLHSHLTICARDSHSAKLLKEKGFTGNLFTLPDMAFCIDREKLQSFTAEATQRSLLLLREDKELKKSELNNGKYLDFFFSDWPQMKESSIKAQQFLMSNKADEADSFFIERFFPQQIKAGVEFVSSYKDVSSTRLHVSILRLLLGMPVTIIDNSYGKNQSFYNTWLKDSELVGTPDEEEQEAIDFAIFIHKHEQKSLRECKKDYEMQIAALKDKQREQEKCFKETRNEQEATIALFRQRADRESQKHRKYKRLFNVTLIAMLLSIVALVTIIHNI